MATICKVEKTIPVHNGNRMTYPTILVWAILDEAGHTVFETGGPSDEDFRLCQEWIKASGCQVGKCLTCED